MTYGFRLRVNLSSAHTLISDDAELSLEVPGWARPLTVSAIGAEKIRDAAQLALRSGGYATEDQAREAANRVREALHAACAIHRVAVDTGNDRASLQLSRVFRQQLESDAERESGEPVQILSDVHGIIVFDEDRRPLFFGGQATGVLGKPVAPVLETLGEQLAKDTEQPPALILALELFNWSPFEKSARARFVTIVTSLEVVADRETRSSDSLAHLDQLLALTQSNKALGPDADNLCSALNQLRAESIGSACKRLVARYGQSGDQELWDGCVALRHKVVHGGLSSDAVAAHVNDLEAVVRRVLTALVHAA